MRSKTDFNPYLARLTQVALAGDAREESFYPALKDLLQEFAQATGRAGVHVTVLPRPTEAGNPDFRVWDGHSRIVGYIEAKTPSTDLVRVEFTEQLERYRMTFPNLILTNFLEFWLYRDGQRIATARLARPFILTQVRAQPPVEDAEGVWALLEQFFQFSLPQPLTAESLAVELAKRTRFLRDVVHQQLSTEQTEGKGHLSGFYEAFQKFLIGGLTPEEFADLYAQTVTYGLFTARTRAANGFTRRVAFDYIPHTVGVLRDLFRYISLGELPAELEWIVDDIAAVLDVADVGEMLDRYYHEGKDSDPIVHFYETFLAHYDPEERERRGVYYTPGPVVSYIVRSLHALLKQKFGKSDGLASTDVTLLDPAAGTMTFVTHAAETATREFTDKYGSGGQEAFLRSHILKNFYAFELMMAPYAVGHLKMAFCLEELGHRLQPEERIPFYLTNTLDMSELEASKLPGLSSLAEESHLAGRVKREQPILVILGNPPYSGHSANKGQWIRDQIETYKRVDGRPLGEKNPKWLQDDYVKFLRFAQWKIEQAGRGVVGMITNHSYLDNPTFRGMRRSLMGTFDEIYVLDLHGSSLKRESCPDGSPDENVFDIRQGVAIAFFIKYGPCASSPQTSSPHTSSPPASSPHAHTSSPHAGRGLGGGASPIGPGGGVYHAELWGRREEKYRWLEAHDWTATPWRQVQPRPEFYLFVPRDEAEQERYHSFPRLIDIFEQYSVGIVTARDHLTIHWTPEEVWTTVLNFSRMDPELARQAYQLGKDARDWKVTLAQQDLRQSGPSRDLVAPILYRPFDVRYTYFTGRSRGFICMPRPEVMGHMLAGENVALCVGRQGQVIGAGEWTLAFCTEKVVDFNLFYRGGNINFPLYLYPDSGRKDLFGDLKVQGRRVNISGALLRRLAEAYGSTPTSPSGMPGDATPTPPSSAVDHPTPAPPPHRLGDPTPTPPPRVRGGGWGEGSRPGQGEGSRWRTSPDLWEKLKPLAREMRQAPTVAEERLWQYLRHKQLLGYKFRRQHPIERFLVDFYSPEANLAIEVDGPVHLYTREEDAIRQAFLESQGLRVLRFTNEQVMEDVAGVVQTITRTLQEIHGDCSSVTPEQVFHYIYAVLYAPSYRERYADFLRMDFPRIPFPARREVFEVLSELGRRLVAVHLLHSPELDPPLARFEGKGDNRIAPSRREGLRYEADAERAYINPTQYFAPVPVEVWEYIIGGYQVCEKWLKDRRGRELTLDDIRTYCRIVTALVRTLALQEEIDELYGQVEADPLSEVCA